jgi:hypothetical protein
MAGAGAKWRLPPPEGLAFDDLDLAEAGFFQQLRELADSGFIYFHITVTPEPDGPA